MTYVNKKIKIYLVLILSFLVSCTYDYQYPTDLPIKYHIVDVDGGFHGMTLDILNQYGASIIYYDREKTITEYDGNGTELRTIKMDLKFVDTFMSSEGAAYIVIKVAMNGGEMGYICTDPIRLNFGQNEITLDENTPVHVELTNNQYPTDHSIKYHIVDVDGGFHGMTLDILNQYGASIIYYDREKTITEYDGNGTELRTIKMDLKFVDTFMSSEGAAYIVIKVAMNGGEMGYICTDPIRLNFGQNEITLDENTPVHVELTNKIIRRKEKDSISPSNY